MRNRAGTVTPFPGGTCVVLPSPLRAGAPAQGFLLPWLRKISHDTGLDRHVNENNGESLPDAVGKKVNPSRIFPTRILSLQPYWGQSSGMPSFENKMICPEDGLP